MQLLKQEAEKFGLILTNEMLEKFQLYSDFLLEYNEKVNLTAITDPKEIQIKHFLDSIVLLDKWKIEKDVTVIDIGTGAGFPSVPLKIVRADLHVTLLDSLNKRLLFLEQLSNKLEQQNKLIHGRAEQIAIETPFREGYQYVVSRAVSNLAVLAEYCIPYVKVGGYFIAYKGPDWKEEYKNGKKSIEILGGTLEHTEDIVLPDGSRRTLLMIHKLKETPDKYPRQGVKIAKKPIL